jgi:hypothetical protein
LHMRINATIRELKTSCDVNHGVLFVVKFFRIYT